MKRWMTALLICMVLLLPQTVTASATTAFIQPIDVTGIESAHSYANNEYKSWVLSCSGADSITMTFSASTELEYSHDWLYVYDSVGTRNMYTGTELAGKTITVNGDKVELLFISDSSKTRWGFQVTEAYGTFTNYDTIVRVENSRNGTIKVSPVCCSFGETVTITAVPNPGCKLKATYVDGVEVAGSFIATNAYHTVSAIFESQIPGKDVVSSGPCGASLNWVIYDDGLLYITGSGAMNTYSSASAVPWAKYQSLITALTIDSSVTSISDYAFANCTALTTVTIPDGVASIGQYAFRGCSKLADVTIPASVTKLTGNTFYNCPLLTSAGPADSSAAIRFDWTDTIHANSLCGSNALTEIIIPDTITTIESDAFNSCESLQNVSIPNGLKKIGDQVFLGCSSLKAVVVPDTVTDFGRGIFYGCSSLTAVVLPASLNTISIDLFRDCSALKNIEIPAGVLTIEEYAFYNCKSLTFVELPNSLISIGQSVFANCYDLTSITLPETLVSIGSYAFSCTSLTEIDIPNSITAIEASVFEHCYDLSKVTIPSSITSIGQKAFYYCTSLTNVILPESLAAIGSYAFSNCSLLDNVNIPATVTSLSSNMFSGCPRLTSAGPASGNYSIRYGWTDTIPAYAFANCYYLQSITIPKTVTTIGNYAFNDCSDLSTVYYAGTEIYWTSISIGSNNTPLTNAERVFIGSTDDVLTFLAAPAENGTFTFTTTACTAGTEVHVIPVPALGYKMSAVYVDGEAIEGTSFIATANHVVSVQFEFYSNVIITGQLSGSLTGPKYYLYENGELYFTGRGFVSDYSDEYSIPWRGFRSQITSLVIDGWITEIGDRALENCSNLERVDIRGRVEAIGKKSFYNCSALTEVVIPDSVENIGYQAFWGCNNLDAVFYTGTEEQWNSIVIDNNNSSLTNAKRYYIDSLDEILHLFVLNTEHGTLKVSPVACVADIQISVTAFPDAGYKLDKITVDGTPIDGNTFVATANHTVSAEFVFYKDVVASGECGENTRWVLYTDGELRITGSGDMLNYGIADVPWNAYRDQIKAVVVEDGVTNVGNNAFRDCVSLTDATIPNSVTTIGNYAFYNCDALTKVIIPNSVTTIGISAFYSCNALTEVTIPDSVENIGGSAFYNCGNLSYVVIGNNVKAIASDAFGSCYELETVFYVGTEGQWNSITISSGNSYLTNAKRYYIDSWDEIFQISVINTEYGTLKVSPVTCVAGVQINVTAFPDAGYKLNMITVDGTPIDGNTFVATANHAVSAEFVFYKDTVAFGECGDNVRWVLYTDGELHITGFGDMLNYGIADVPWNAYRYQIKAVLIEEGITSIGSNAFYNCTSLADVTIPDGVKSIYHSAFYGCSALTEVFIPDSVESIENQSFCGCVALADVAISDGVKSIEGYAFSNCSALTEVIIPDSVESIGQYAFSNCTALTHVVIGNGVSSIGQYAFHLYSGSKLEWVEFRGDAPSSFGSYVFPHKTAGQFVIYYHSGASGWTTPTWNGYYTVCINTELSEFSALSAENRNSQGILFTLNDESMTAVVGDNSTTVNNSGYYGNNSGQVILPANVTKGGKTYRVIGIGQHAFSGNKLLKTLELGANITSVDSTAFLEATSLRSFSVAEGSTHYSAADGILYDAVGYYLYFYPAAKTGGSYTVPAAVKTIGQYAFAYNSHLTELVIPGNVQTIGECALESCDGLQSLTLPFLGASKESSGRLGYLFKYGNSYYAPASLRTVIVTDGKLSYNAFGGCSNLETISLPAQDTEIPNSCFSGCTALTRLIFTDTAEASKDLEPGYVIIPDRITSIGYDAFYGCAGLKIIELPAGLSTIGNSAFADCTGMTKFVVDAKNRNFCTDKWGVLYSKDLSRLISYPADRKWPYYNVSDSTKTIASSAFTSCANLVNLYIPNNVETMESSSVWNCPGMTICAYSDSTAYAYAGVNSLNAWPMDNYTLQGIEIYALPEQVVAKMGEESFEGLYMAGSYGGKELQLDDYTVTYDPDKSGIQTVTVSFGGYTESFEILLYDGDTEKLVDFGELNLESETVGYIAVYNAAGKMQKVEEAKMMDGRVLIVVSKDAQAVTVKLFLMNKGSLIPISAPIQPKPGQ